MCVKDVDMDIDIDDTDIYIYIYIYTYVAKTSLNTYLLSVYYHALSPNLAKTVNSSNSCYVYLSFLSFATLLGRILPKNSAR